MKRAILSALGLLLAGCAGGPPIHTSRPAPDPSTATAPPPGSPAAEPAPPRDERSFREGVDVRVGLHWERGTFEIGSAEGMRVTGAGASEIRVPGGQGLVATARNGTSVRLAERGGRVLREDAGPIRIAPIRADDTVAGERSVRGHLVLSARADSLFVVNVLPLEDYLRGVVPREIGPRPPRERAAVAAQAVAARTYTVKRLGQYNSLPFDVYASVQDQVYQGIDEENAVADAAIADTRGLILANRTGPIEAYYASTCGGRRSDIACVWPHREVFPSLRGGADGVAGREWCRGSPHFRWTETWDGRTLSELVRRNVPVQLELPPGSVRGELVDVRIGNRGPSGRAGTIDYVTTAGHWTVPGDKNRWILRRPDGGILRSVFVNLDVERRGGRVVRVTAAGRGNGHGVGMCQVGAIGRAQAGQDFRTILRAYYPGAEVRPVRGSDLPGGRTGAS